MTAADRTPDHNRQAGEPDAGLPDPSLQDAPVADAPLVEALASAERAAQAEHATSTHPDARAVNAGRLWIVLAAVMWSSSGLFAKSPLFTDWPDESRGILLAFWRALFAGALLIPAVRRPRWDARLVPFCLTFALMNVSYLSAMTLTTAAVAIWMQSTAPWWVFLAGVLFMREPFSRWERIPLAFGAVGLSVILYFELQGQTPAGVLCGLFSGFTYAGVVLSLRALRSHDAVWLVVVSHLATAALMLPYILYLNSWPSVTQLGVLSAFGLFQMALPYVFFARGLRTVTSQEATGIGLLEPLLLPLWVYLAWGESPATSTLLGGAFILAGLALRYALPLLAERQATGD